MSGTDARAALLAERAQVQGRLAGLERDFATTVEAYRLVELGLLVVPGGPPAPAGDRVVGWPVAVMSFMRAVPGGEGQ